MAAGESKQRATPCSARGRPHARAPAAVQSRRTCSGSGSSKSCTEYTYTHNWVANATSTWTGCITDRTQTYDADRRRAIQAAATLFPANQYYENGSAYCATNSSPPLEQVMPLSYNWTTLKTNVNAMQPTGGTDQSVGLAWGWQSLLQTGPIPAPAEDPNYDL